VDALHPDATALRAACNIGPRQRVGVPPNLSLFTGATTPERRDPSRGSRLRLTLVVTDGGAIRMPTRGRRTFTWLAVSAGFATADQLAALAVRCFDAGRPITAVIVANPDPVDRTTGRLAPTAPLATALDEWPAPADERADEIDGMRTGR
jgi:hypothetical protein